MFGKRILEWLSPQDGLSDEEYEMFQVLGRENIRFIDGSEYIYTIIVKDNEFKVPLKCDADTFNSVCGLLKHNNNKPFYIKIKIDRKRLRIISVDGFAID